MNNKQKKTLEAVNRKKGAGTIDWSDIESLFVACGCEVVEGPGSAVSFVHGTQVAYFHRPHPEKEAKRYQIKVAREFLVKIGVGVEDEQHEA